MKRVSIAGLWLAFSAALSSTAGAQGGMMAGSARKPISVVVSGGLTVPSGDLADFHDTGFHYDASMIFTFPGLPIAIRPELSLTTLKFKDSRISPVPGTSATNVDDLRTRMLSAVGNVEIPLAAGLYAIAGVGALNSKVTGLETDSDGQTALTFGAGAGFRFHISRIDGFVEGRFGAASYEKGKIGYSKAQFIPLTFGLVF